MPYVNVLYGSDEWNAWQKEGIVGEDAPAIVGSSPWDTPYSLWRFKTGQATETLSAVATPPAYAQLPHARAAYQSRTGMPLKPVCFQDASYPYRRASVDGITDDGAVVSIVTPTLQDHEQALGGALPVHHLAKIQHLLACLSEVACAHYVSWQPGAGESSLAVVEVKRDDRYIELLSQAEDHFWACVFENRPPYEDAWADAAWRWRKAKQLADAADTVMELVRSELSGLLPEGGDKREAGGVSFSRSLHRGTVDYKALIEDLALAEETVERFRKPSKLVEILRVKGNPEPPPTGVRRPLS